jgi:hypothetical protein
MPAEAPSLTEEQEEYIATLLEFSVEHSGEPVGPELAGAVVARIMGALSDDHPLAGEADLVIARGLECLEACERGLR